MFSVSYCYTVGFKHAEIHQVHFVRSCMHITQCSPVALMHFIPALSFYSHSCASYRSSESKISIQLSCSTAYQSQSLARHPQATHSLVSARSEHITQKNYKEVHLDGFQQRLFNPSFFMHLNNEVNIYQQFIHIYFLITSVNLSIIVTFGWTHVFTTNLFISKFSRLYCWEDQSKNISSYLTYSSSRQCL